MSWIVGGALLALVLVAMDRLATRIVRPSLQPVAPSIPELGLPYQDVAIESGDLRLRAWLVGPAAEEGGEGAEALDEPVVVMVHGWGANHSVVSRLGAPLARRGHDVLLFDVRGHGRNPERSVVTIRDFRDDLSSVCRWTEERFPGRSVIVVGHSMGGAAGVLVAADGAPVDGLVLIAAPSDVLTITAEYLSDHGMPGGFLVTVLRPFFWRRVGGTFRPLTPSRRIGEVGIPLLMIQPELDARVVRSHADRLAEAAGVDYEVIEDREHTDVLSDERTLRLVEEFLQTF